LRYLKPGAAKLRYVGAMPTVLFRCPNLGAQVQGWVATEASEAGDDVYETVTCTACRQLHLVNPTTGRVLGAPKE